MRDKTRKLEFAAGSEIQRRAREIQIIVNLLVPDAQMQPWFISDESGISEIGLLDPETIKLRLESYFGRPHNLSLDLPLWRLVDQIKEIYPGWPDDWPPINH
jgi:hypothetical protein